MARDLNPRTEGVLFAERSRERFTAFTQRFDETAFGARLRISFGRALGMEMLLERREREGVALTDSYSEFNGGVFFRYAGAFGRRASTAEE